MKLYIRIFKDNYYGNCGFDVIIIPNNTITVYKLKQILYEKYGILHSNQRLSVKMGKKQFVIMTNEYPLNFFFIKEKSKIYVEFIQTQTKMEEISQKIIKKDVKSKYLKRLGFLQGCLPMGIIKESPIEDLDEDYRFTSPGISRKKKIKHNQNKIDNSPTIDFKKKIRERLTNAIIRNKIDEFREILNNHYEFIDINNPLDSLQKFSAIHYSAFYGYKEMLQYLINDYKVDVNALSVDKWSALHLSTYKGNVDIVNILIRFHETNCDLCLAKIGTALHLACKRNDFKIVALLLNKCDPTIKNDNGKLPIEITNDKNIKKLISKIMYSSSDNKIIDKSEEWDLKVKHDKNANKKNKKNHFNFLNLLSNVPEKPPRYLGFVYKKGKYLLHYNLRYIEVDPFKGLFFRYEYKNDYPNKPLEVLMIKDIKSCKRINENNKKYFFMEITFNNVHLFRFESLKACESWIEAINKCIIYYKFWEDLAKKYDEVPAYLTTLNQDIIEINVDGEKTNLTPKINNDNKSNKGNRIRRKNPYSKKNEDESKLLEDPILNDNIGMESFGILDCIGIGNFGKVYKVKMKSNGQKYIMKVINKKYLFKSNQLRYVVDECNELKQVKSPFISTLYFAFQTSENLYLIIDYCPGGNLLDHILRNLFEEDEAKFYIAELILGIEQLHNLNILYRDLKPENIYISSDNHIKLADFGFAKEKEDLKISKSIYGSHAYLDPEILERKGTERSADIYGIGAVLYEMVCGTPPFFANNTKILYKDKSQIKLMLHDYLSDELKDLLSQLLCKNPQKRIGISDKNEIKNHPWFNDIDWDKLAKKEIDPPLDLVEMKEDFYNNIEDENKIKDINYFDDKYYDNNEKINKIFTKFTFIRSQNENK